MSAVALPSVYLDECVDINLVPLLKRRGFTLSHASIEGQRRRDPLRPGSRFLEISLGAESVSAATYARLSACAIRVSPRWALVALFALGAAGLQVYLQPRLEGLVFAEMLLEPWLILQGLMPYRDFYQQHAPLVSYLLAAVLAVAPQQAATVVAVHTALVVALTLGVVACGARLGGPRLAVAGGVAYVLLLPRLDGGLPWLEPFVAADLLLLLPLLGASGVPRSRSAALVAGFVVGVGVLLKQTAAVGLLAIVACTLWAAQEGRLSWRGSVEYVAASVVGGAVPLALAVLWFAAHGALGAFLDQTLFSNLRYAREAALAPSETDWPVVVLMVALPLAALAVSVVDRPSRRLPPAAFVPLLALGSLATLLPRYAEFHYQQALPFLALSAGLLVCWLVQVRSALDRARRPATLALALVAGVALASVGALTVPLLVRLLPSPEVRLAEEPLDDDLAGWLAPRVQPRERVLILGDTRLHLATNTLPATRHLYLFPWMYDASEVRADAERTRPRYAVVDTAALDDPPTLDYLAQEYRLVYESGTVEVRERRREPSR